MMNQYVLSLGWLIGWLIDWLTAVITWWLVSSYNNTTTELLQRDGGVDSDGDGGKGWRGEGGWDMVLVWCWSNGLQDFELAIPNRKLIKDVVVTVEIKGKMKEVLLFSHHQHHHRHHHVTYHPSSIIDHPSISHHPSIISHRHQLSAIIHHPSPIIRQPSFITHRSSLVIIRWSLMIRATANKNNCVCVQRLHAVCGA